MKMLFYSLAIFFTSILTTTAQDFYLPVSTNSEMARTAYYQAVDLAANLHFKEGRAQIDIAIEQDPHFFMAYAFAIQVFASEEEKKKLIDEALALDATTFNQAEGIMRQQLQAWKKDLEAPTTKAMKALVDAYPASPQAYEWAALHTAFSEKNPKQALKYALKLVELRPDYAPNYNTLGYIYMGEGQMNKAKTAFNQYIELAPQEANPYDSMGDYYMNKKEYEKAAQSYDKAAAKGMTSAKERAAKARQMM